MNNVGRVCTASTTSNSHPAANHERFTASLRRRQRGVPHPPPARQYPYAAKAREIPRAITDAARTSRRSERARARTISSLSTAINRHRRDIFIYVPASNPPCTVRRLHRAPSPFSPSCCVSLFRRYVNRNRLPRLLSSAAAYQAAAAASRRLRRSLLGKVLEGIPGGYSLSGFLSTAIIFLSFLPKTVSRKFFPLTLE